MKLRTILSFTILCIATFGFMSTAEAARFCKGPRYYHNASDSICKNRAKNYCRTNRRFHICSSSSESQTTATGSCASIQNELTRCRTVVHPGSSCPRTTRKLNQCLSNNSSATTTTQASTTASGKCSSIQAELTRCRTVVHPGSSCPRTTRKLNQCLGNGSTTAGNGPSTSASPNGSVSCSSPRTAFQCMMCNCHKEAGNQSFAGKLAVGKVVMTRARMSSYPNSVCGVVYQGWTKRYSQFSWTTSRSNRNKKVSGSAYRACYKAVKDSLNYNGHYASHYHANYVFPKWRRSCRGKFTIGAHHFYASCGNQSRASTTRSVAFNLNMLLFGGHHE